MSPGRGGRSTNGVAARGGCVAEQVFDRLHRLDDLRLFGAAAAPQHRGHLGARLFLERRQHRPAAAGHGQFALAGVGGGRSPSQQATLLETAQDPAQVAGVQSQVAAEIGGAARRAVRQLVEHAGFGQRQRGVEQVLAEHADPAGVETVEGADGVDVASGSGRRHDA